MYYNNSDVRLEEMPRPEIGERELLVKVRACGICGSDVMEWYRIQKAPLVLGHELSGDIVEAGNEVEGFEKGDRVFVTHHVPCNSCRYCRAGHHSVCDTLRSTNFHPGGFSEYLRVPGINVDRGVLKIPPDMTYEQASFIEPLGCVYRGQRLAGFRPGMDVLVVGSGVTGLLFVKLLGALGAASIITADINDYKLRKSLEFGADHAIDARSDVPGKIQKLNNGRKADLVVTCTGAPAAVDTAIRSVDRGGTILFFAPPGPDVRIGLPLFDVWKDEIDMVTTYAASPDDNAAALELIASGKVVVDDMITHRLPLADTGKGFGLVARSGECLKVIIEPDR